MNKKIRVSCVSYTNSRPFIFGLQHNDIFDEILLRTDHPALIAEKLINDETDLGLVPVAAIPSITNSEIISQFCIAADNEVGSVLLLSDVPVERIKTILLDYQSLSSVNLVKILAREHWKIDPDFAETREGFIAEIKNEVAAVVIGDRALNSKSRHRYVYDLAGEWRQFTGLPFVFACWVSNKQLPDQFRTRFNKALEYGVDRIGEVLAEMKSDGSYFHGAEMYLKENLSYRLDEARRTAMDTFLAHLDNLNDVALRADH